jgi:hypothetical protein
MRPARRCSRAPSEPVGELARHRLGEAVQQLARLRAGGSRRTSMSAHRAGDVAASSSSRPRRLAQPEQALAQVGAGALGVDVGPEQGRQPAARRSAPRSPGRRAAGRPSARARDPTVAAHELRLAGEVQGVATGRGVRHGRGAEGPGSGCAWSSLAARVAEHSPRGGRSKTGVPVCSGAASHRRHAIGLAAGLRRSWPRR